MSSFNKVILLGNLTRDPEHRVTANGNQVCKLGIAVSERYTTQGGEHREETTFVDVDAWGRQAETIHKYFSKGRQILIEGRLRLDEWESPQGERRSKLKVVLDRFSFVNDGQGSGSTTSPQPQPVPESTSTTVQQSPQPQNTAQETAETPPAEADGDDDVPF